MPVCTRSIPSRLRRSDTVARDPRPVGRAAPPLGEGRDAAEELAGADCPLPADRVARLLTAAQADPRSDPRDIALRRSPVRVRLAPSGREPPRQGRVAAGSPWSAPTGGVVGEPGAARIWAAAIQAAAVMELSRERSDLDGGIQEVAGSSPASSISEARPVSAGRPPVWRDTAGDVAGERRGGSQVCAA
jgi:hypothetical protein